MLLMPATLWVIHKGGLPVLVTTSLMAVIGAFELYRMIARKGYRPFFFAGILTTLGFVGNAYLDGQLRPSGLAALLLFSAVLTAIEEAQWRLTRTEKKPRNVWLDVSLSLAGAVYLGVPLSYVIRLRSLPNGRALTFTTALCGTACDSTAYLIGKLFGRHHLALAISPGKTWEGAIAGVLASILVGTALARYFGLPMIHGPILGGVIGITVVYGDLVESMVKRYVGVKDSGNWIPGQGGLLDMIDGAMLAALSAYYYAVWVVGIE